MSEMQNTSPVWLTRERANCLPERVDATRVTEKRVDLPSGGFVPPGVGYMLGSISVYEDGKAGELWHRSEEDALRRARALFTHRLAKAHAEIATVLELGLQVVRRLAELMQTAAIGEVTS